MYIDQSYCFHFIVVNLLHIKINLYIIYYGLMTLGYLSTLDHNVYIDNSQHLRNCWLSIICESKFIFSVINLQNLHNVQY